MKYPPGIPFCAGKRAIIMKGRNTMFFNQNADKETIKILLSENKRLKRDNQRLNDSLNELQNFKNEYRELIDKLNQLKETYQKRLKKFDQLEKQYKKELDKLIR